MAFILSGLSRGIGVTKNRINFETQVIPATAGIQCRGGDRISICSRGGFPPSREWRRRDDTVYWK